MNEIMNEHYVLYANVVPDTFQNILKIQDKDSVKKYLEDNKIR